jgi:hypothetical protein
VTNERAFDCEKGKEVVDNFVDYDEKNTRKLKDNDTKRLEKYKTRRLVDYQL